MFLKLAHQVWKDHLKPGNSAIDATCGNGYDTDVLARFDLAHLYVFDIQKKALNSTKSRVGENKNISYHLECHSTFSSVKGSVDLIVYNLGYLPGGNKSLTTNVQTTIKSIETGTLLLNPGGLISCMLYPGHPEGAREESALLDLTANFSSKKFQISHHRSVNRSRAPSLLLIQKIIY
ncbi:MAG: class I SAM-dependent methyltransferase [Simkaniaceae bacterium]|nr:MAG: class I SAM-dependent methyltransferase [Simkaniaceae bacterium]